MKKIVAILFVAFISFGAMAQEKVAKIEFKTECPSLGEEILSTYSVKFYEHKTKPKTFIKEKVITNYNTVSDGSNFRQISSILDEIDIFDRFKDKKFTSKLLDYYVCEKDDDIVLYFILFFFNFCKGRHAL